jgi:hypothetical protein
MGIISKLASIGIGPGKAPSTEANNTIKTALQTGITEGEKLIDAKWSNVRTVVNGWFVNMKLVSYGTDYLLRAAATEFACCANIAQESLYPIIHTDVEGKSLSGANNYAIHFNPKQTPPVKAFWSITMYNTGHCNGNNCKLVLKKIKMKELKEKIRKEKIEVA